MSNIHTKSGLHNFVLGKAEGIQHDHNDSAWKCYAVDSGVETPLHCYLEGARKDGFYCEEAEVSQNKKNENVMAAPEFLGQAKCDKTRNRDFYLAERAVSQFYLR